MNSGTSSTDIRDKPSLRQYWHQHLKKELRFLLKWCWSVHPTVLTTNIVDIFPSTISAFKPEIDISPSVAEKLMPPLLSSLESKNSAVRDASQHATMVLVAHCRSLEASQLISDCLLKALKDGTPKECVAYGRTVRRHPYCDSSDCGKRPSNIGLGLFLYRPMFTSHTIKRDQRFGNVSDDRCINRASGDASRT
jgi:hypothetical protein